MTFSANPARISFLERMRRLPAAQRALGNLCIVALVLMLGGALISFFFTRAVVHEQAAQLGGALATDAAERAAEFLAHSDLVSLNVITASLSRHPGVAGAVVYDRSRQPLAQSGDPQPRPDTITVSADILSEENELRGTVDIVLRPRATLQTLDGLNYALAGWLGFSIVLLLFVIRIQRDSLNTAHYEDAVAASTETAQARNAAIESTAAIAPDAGTDLAADIPPLSNLPEGAILRIDIVNYATLEQRLAPRMLAELNASYAELLERACGFYQGEVTRPLTHQCMVTFPSLGASDEDVLFRAICCAQLFFGVVREVNLERRKLSKTTMQFSAALHQDPTLGRDDCAIVTWEICTNAGEAGRLTVTDAITGNAVLGERLVVDNARRQVLEIELPGEDETSRRQDVLALGVLRLTEPYEELIARQVKRLCEPATA